MPQVGTSDLSWVSEVSDGGWRLEDPEREGQMSPLHRQKRPKWVADDRAEKSLPIRYQRVVYT